MFAHVIIAGGVSFITLLFAFPILQVTKIPSEENPFKMQRHIIIGTCILSVILAQVLMGLATNIMKQIRSSPTIVIFSLNTAHKYLGYILAFLAKFQAYLIMDFNGDHPVLWKVLTATDCLFAAAFIIQKIWFPTFAKEIMPKYENLGLKSIASVRELKKT